MTDATTSREPDVLASRLDDIRSMLERTGPAARTTSPVARLDVVLAITGSVMLPLGLAVVWLGWYGAAHTPFVFEQIPYLISGGLLGVGLVIAGGLLFFGSWFARLAEQDRVGSENLVAAIDRLRGDLAAMASAPSATGRVASMANGSPLVATPTGTMVHRPDCSVVARRTDLQPVLDGPGDYRVCKLCDPLGATETV